MESGSSNPKPKKSAPVEDEPTRKRKEADDRQEQQPKTKRQRAEEQQDNRAEIEKTEKAPNYRHLTAVTRHYNLALEAQLTPVLHSNELLEAELRKEEILLENEQKYLADLEANAKDEASKRRQTARKAHPLLQSEESIPREELDSILGPDAPLSPPVTLNASKYQDLEEIMKSISGHVGSIQGNLEQIDGIGEAMTKTKAAVQATLFRHLDREQFDDVVLG
ncbi:kinetochore fta7 protein [Rutstroemia sp. NJR-2017a BBW]|nr:kinetochore fta7 protein [Rutstroemia sp. NJR-2017a BBW]